MRKRDDTERHQRMGTVVVAADVEGDARREQDMWSAVGDEGAEAFRVTPAVTGKSSSSSHCVENACRHRVTLLLVHNVQM